MARFTTCSYKFLLILVLGLSALNLGCLQDSSNSNISAQNTLSGTAATGLPLLGFVYIRDANGIEINTQTAADGSYEIIPDGLVAPLIFRAVPDDGGPVQYSWSEISTGVVNITPLTSLSLLLAFDHGDLNTLYDNWAFDNAALTEQAVVAAQAIVNANFSGFLLDNGLDYLSYDFFNTPFLTNGAGIDAVMDIIEISFDYDLGEFFLGQITNAESIIDFDETIDTIDILLDIADLVGQLGAIN